MTSFPSKILSSLDNAICTHFKQRYSKSFVNYWLFQPRPLTVARYLSPLLRNADAPLLLEIFLTASVLTSPAATGRYLPRTDRHYFPSPPMNRWQWIVPININVRNSSAVHVKLPVSDRPFPQDGVNVTNVTMSVFASV